MKAQLPGRVKRVPLGCFCHSVQGSQAAQIFYGAATLAIEPLGKGAPSPLLFLLIRLFPHAPRFLSLQCHHHTPTTSMPGRCASSNSQPATAASDIPPFSDDDRTARPTAGRPGPAHEPRGTAPGSAAAPSACAGVRVPGGDALVPRLGAPGGDPASLAQWFHRLGTRIAGWRNMDQEMLGMLRTMALSYAADEQQQQQQEQEQQQRPWQQAPQQMHQDPGSERYWQQEKQLGQVNVGRVGSKVLYEELQQRSAWQGKGRPWQQQEQLREGPVKAVESVDKGQMSRLLQLLPEKRSRAAAEEADAQQGGQSCRTQGDADGQRADLKMPEDAHATHQPCPDLSLLCGRCDAPPAPLTVTCAPVLQQTGRTLGRSLNLASDPGAGTTLSLSSISCSSYLHGTGASPQVRP